jgi:hypothetical protein
MMGLERYGRMPTIGLLARANRYGNKGITVEGVTVKPYCRPSCARAQNGPPKEE